jgi:hypothetical protein
MASPCASRAGTLAPSVGVDDVDSVRERRRGPRGCRASRPTRGLAAEAWGRQRVGVGRSMKHVQSKGIHREQGRHEQTHSYTRQGKDHARMTGAQRHTRRAAGVSHHLDQARTAVVIQRGKMSWSGGGGWNVAAEWRGMQGCMPPWRRPTPSHPAPADQIIANSFSQDAQDEDVLPTHAGLPAII